MGRGGTVLGIIGIVLAAGAFGFTFIGWNGQNTINSDLDDLTDEVNDLESDFSNLTRTIVVGIWETLSDNLNFVPYNSQNNWLLEFGDNRLNNTDYISVSNINTRITLLKSGWYQIHLSVLLAGISPSSIYTIRILKDGVTESFLDFYQTAVTIDSNYHSIDSSAFVYSNGTNFIEINGDSADDFSVPANDLYNQLTIKFVAI